VRIVPQAGRPRPDFLRTSEPTSSSSCEDSVAGSNESKSIRCGLIRPANPRPKPLTCRSNQPTNDHRSETGLNRLSTVCSLRFVQPKERPGHVWSSGLHSSRVNPEVDSVEASDRSIRTSRRLQAHFFRWRTTVWLCSWDRAGLIDNVHHPTAICITYSFFHSPPFPQGTSGRV